MARRSKNLTYPPSVHFGEVLKARREAAQLSRSQLSARAKVAAGTIKNLEKGVHGPLCSTLVQLCGVEELGLDLATMLVLLGEGEQQRGTPLWMPGFDPRALVRTLRGQLAGSGGVLDPSLLFLDSGSANWQALAARRRVRARTFPLAEVARAAVTSSPRGLDLWALGCGAAEEEIALAAHMAPRYESDFFLSLLDINASLLVQAGERAERCLPGLGALVVQGDLLRFPAYEPIGSKAQRQVPRLVTLLGGTLGHFDESAMLGMFAGLRPGDLVLVDAHLHSKRSAASPQSVPALDHWLLGVFSRYNPVPGARAVVRTTVHVAREGGCTLEHRVCTGEEVMRSFVFLRETRHERSVLESQFRQAGLGVVKCWLRDGWGLWLLRHEGT